MTDEIKMLDAKMKMPQMPARLRTRRKPQSERLAGGWEMSTREWADLPIYHPRND
jgi:hypothetical protein